MDDLRRKTPVLQTLPGTNHCQREGDCLVSAAPPSLWEHVDLSGDPGSPDSPGLRSPPHPHVVWDQPNRAGLHVGAKPWQVPGGLKSPRDNEGVAGAQCCGQLQSHLVWRVTGGGPGPIPVGGTGMGCHRGRRRRRVTKFGSTRGGLAEDWSPALCCSLRPGCDPRRIPAPTSSPGLTLRGRGGASGLCP